MERTWKVKEFARQYPQSRACFQFGVTAPAAIRKIQVKGARCVLELAIEGGAVESLYREGFELLELEPGDTCDVQPGQAVTLLVDAGPVATDLAVTWFLVAAKRPHPMAEFVF